MMARTFVLLGITLALLTPSLAAQVVVDSSGRTISISPSLDDTTSTFIQVVGGAAGLTLRYRLSDAAPEHVPVLGSADKELTAGKNGFEIPADIARPFVLFNLLQKKGLTTTDLDKLKADLEDLEKKLRDQKNGPDYVELLRLEKPEDFPPTADELEKARLTWEIAVLEKEEAAYTKLSVNASIVPLARVEADLRILRQQLAVVERRIRAAELTNRKRKEELAQSKAVKQVADRMEEIEEKTALAFAERLQVLKLGVFVRGPRRKQAVFSFPPFVLGQLIRLKLVSDLPVLDENDALYMIVTNRQSERHPSSYTFSVKSAKGTPISEAKVRPPADSEAATDVPQPSAGLKAVTTDETYDDLIFGVGKRFNGNDVPKLTLSATATVVTEDKETLADGKPTRSKTTELMDVKLLDDFELPQVHPLFRFNIATGVTLSGVEDQTFAKVQTQLDNPDTSANEARYRIDTSRKGREIRPIIAITWYLRPVDPLLPLRARDRATPHPTLGFGVSEPAKNVFLGFSNEIFRGVQLLWGYHRGSITELQPRTDVAEDAQSTLPPTRSNPDGAAFVGVTINLNALGKIFGITY